MKYNIKTKEDALKAIDELKDFVKGDDNIEWVTIDYSKIPQEYFEKYGVKPFQIMKKKMRNDEGNVWNNISYFDARKEAEKRGWRLPNIREQMMLLDFYSSTVKEPNVYDNEFLGIEELSYSEDVNHEWIECNEKVAFLRGGYWNNGTIAGVETLTLYNTPSYTGSSIGFRCARDIN